MSRGPVCAVSEGLGIFRNGDLTSTSGTQPSTMAMAYNVVCLESLGQPLPTTQKRASHA